MTTECTDLARKSTVRELVAAFQRAEQTVRESFAALATAEREVNEVFTLGGDYREIRLGVSKYSHGEMDFKESDYVIETMRRSAWRIIVERLELRKAMSIKRFEAMEEQLRNGELPPVTQENVEAFASAHMDQLGAMLKEAIQEVFDWLRPRRSEYKRNSEYEVPAKLILTSMTEGGFWGRRVSSYQTQKLVALENVFNALAGQGQVAKQYQSALQTAIEASQDGTGETDLFRFKAFKNRNLHLEFKRLDLLAAFNAIAGGKRLHTAA